MKTVCLLNSKPIHFPKPSVVLKKAYLKGIKRSINSFKDGDSYCARGIIIKEFAEYNGYTMDEDSNTMLLKLKNDLTKRLEDEIDDPELKSYIDSLGPFIFEYELFGWYKFKKHFGDLTHFERSVVGEILFELGMYNDRNPDITFMDCAKYLEERGL